MFGLLRLGWARLFDDDPDAQGGGSAVAEESTEPSTEEFWNEWKAKQDAQESSGDDSPAAEVVDEPSDDEPHAESRDSPSEDAPPERDDEFRTAMQEYGLTDDDVSDFASVEEVRRYGRLLDRSMGRMFPRQDYPQSEPEPEPKEEPKPAEDTGPSPADLLRQMEASGEWDEQTLAPLKAMVAHNQAMQARQDALERSLNEEREAREAERQWAAQIARQSQEQEETAFLGALGELDGELFQKGKSGWSEEQQNAIRLVADMAETLQAGHQIRTGQVRSFSDFAKRAYDAVFPDRIEQKAKRSQSEKALKQSKKVMGSGRPHTPADVDEKAWDGDPDTDPMLPKMLAAYESGDWTPGQFAGKRR